MEQGAVNIAQLLGFRDRHAFPDQFLLCFHDFRCIHLRELCRKVLSDALQVLAVTQPFQISLDPFRRSFCRRNVLSACFLQFRMFRRISCRLKAICSEDPDHIRHGNALHCGTSGDGHHAADGLQHGRFCDLRKPQSF